MQSEFDGLRAKFPRLIKPNFGFECGAGWISILDRYFGEVDALLPVEVEWSNRQIKQKFGTLRLYCEALWPGKEPAVFFAFDVLNTGTGLRAGGDKNNEIDRRLDWARYRAEGRSAHMCEQCGKPGVIRLSGGYYHTACEVHAMDGKPVETKGAILQFEGKRFQFDVEKDDIAEIEGEADNG